MKLKAFVQFSVLGAALFISACEQKQIPKQQPKEVKVSSKTLEAISNTPKQEPKKDAPKNDEQKEKEVPAPESKESNILNQQSVQLQLCQATAEAPAKPAAKYQRSEKKLTQGSIADLAKKTGFASRLPKSTEIYVGYKDMDQLVRSMFKSKIAKMFEELVAGENFLGSALEDRDYTEFMSIAGEDIFIAGGKDSANLLTGFAKLGAGFMKYEMRREYLRMIARMEEDDNWWRAGRGAPKFLTERDGAFAILKDLKISPVYAGFKVSDKERRNELVQILQEGLNEPVQDQPQDKPFFTAVKSDLEGGFAGFKLDGAAMAKAIKGDRIERSIIDDIGKPLYEDSMKEIAKHQFVLMVGTVGDYIVFYAGKDEKDIAFAKSPDESVLANPEISFARNYADKDVKGIAFLSDSAMKEVSLLKAEIPAIADAYANAVAESDYFGDTREIQDRIREVGKKGAFLFDLFPKSRLGIAIYLENGLVIDSYLGKDSAVFDLDNKRNLAAMASHDGAFISGSWVLKPSFTKQCSELLEVATKTTYKIMQLAVEQDVHDDEWLEFASNFRVADREFTQDLIRVWKTLQAGLTGLSNEHALMIDLKGKLPSSAKDAPKPILEHGLIPRVAYGSNVTGRAKLAKAWEDMAAVAKDIGNGVGKLAKKDISLPKPQLQKKGGLDLWSYALEGFDKDGKPTLALNDKHFFLTSSPTYAQELAAQDVDAASAGAELVIRMEPVRVAATHWLKLMTEHGEKFLSDREWQEFKALTPMLKKAIEVSKEFKKIDIYTRKIDGEIRNTIHLNTK